MLLRPLLLLAVAGLLLLPDWSTARPFRRPVPVFAAPLPCPTSFQYAPPVAYSPPVYSAAGCCLPVSAPSSAACPPATSAPKGPTVVPERMAEPRATDQKPPAVKGMSTDATRDPKPAPSVIRPVGNEDRLPPMQVPMAPPRAAEPQPAPAKPPVEFATPKPIAEESQKPPLKSDPLPAFPLSGKDKELKADGLPTFDLPPLPPLPPPVAPEKPTTAKSSPLNADAPVEVYPLAGPAPADPAAKRRVGFVNKSGRDVLLTVAGKLTTLPSGHALQLTLPAKFAWQIGGEKESEVTVPDGAPGVDVVIRR